MKKRAFYFIISYIRRSFSRNNHYIQTTIEYIFMQPVALSQKPGHMMSYNTVTYFFTDAYSHSVYT